MSTRKGKHRDVMSTSAAPSASPVADGAAEDPLDAMSGRRAEESSAQNIGLAAPVIAEAQPIPVPQESQSIIPREVDGAVSFEGTSTLTAKATVVSADSVIAKLEEGPSQPVQMARMPPGPLEKESFVILAIACFLVLLGLLAASGYMLVTETNISNEVRNETISDACSKYTDSAAYEFCVTRANEARNSHMKEIWTRLVGGVLATLATSLIGYFVYKGAGKRQAPNDT